ncbi:hypothetical protein D3C71_1851670 [compost metagenome]
MLTACAVFQPGVLLVKTGEAKKMQPLLLAIPGIRRLLGAQGPQTIVAHCPFARPLERTPMAKRAEGDRLGMANIRGWPGLVHKQF